MSRAIDHSSPGDSRSISTNPFRIVCGLRATRYTVSGISSIRRANLVLREDSLNIALYMIVPNWDGISFYLLCTMVFKSIRIPAHISVTGQSLLHLYRFISIYFRKRQFKWHSLSSAEVMKPSWILQNRRLGSLFAGAYFCIPMRQLA